MIKIRESLIDRGNLETKSRLLGESSTFRWPFQPPKIPQLSTTWLHNSCLTVCLNSHSQHSFYHLLFGVHECVHTDKCGKMQCIVSPHLYRQWWSPTVAGFVVEGEWPPADSNLWKTATEKRGSAGIVDSRLWGHIKEIKHSWGDGNCCNCHFW